MDQRWTCDIVEEPADWVPLITRLVANQHFYARANQSRFTNIKGSDPASPGATADGQLPYDCGVPESLLGVPADGTTLCESTGTLRCLTDANCDDAIFETLDSCDAGCCNSFIPE
jgi:hypothetical protein